MPLRRLIPRYFRPANTCRASTLRSDQTVPHITAASDNLVIERAISKDAREMGLSNRPCMPANSAILFVFERADRHCFWMKDMRFPIDIVWLDDVKKVVHVQPGVTPDTYPQSFCPDSPARYVLELNVGQAAARELFVGSQAVF